jgi:membrane protein DedA with SNARE-associated domain
MAVPDVLSGLPFWLLLTVLSLGAMARGQIIYWIGRVATEQTLRRTRPVDGWWARAHRWLSAGHADAGIVVIRRWGLIAIPFSYVTIGLQSMIQAGAGVLRITWWKYTLAQIPGALAWGAIYASFGFFAWSLIGQAARGNPAAAIGLAVLGIVLIGGLVLVRRRSEEQAEAIEDELADAPERT